MTQFTHSYKIGCLAPSFHNYSRLSVWYMGQFLEKVQF